MPGNSLTFRMSLSTASRRITSRAEALGLCTLILMAPVPRSFHTWFSASEYSLARAEATVSSSSSPVVSSTSGLGTSFMRTTLSPSFLMGAAALSVAQSFSFWSDAASALAVSAVAD